MGHGAGGFGKCFRLTYIQTLNIIEPTLKEWEGSGEGVEEEHAEY